mmetsp:Transcript_103255/g.179482  ORF Transcript_103255/g.179482 Transcript_103255/m.179482 type:complete len:203 (-) Transcript_103255:893-1501(-)
MSTSKRLTAAMSASTAFIWALMSGGTLVANFVVGDIPLGRSKATVLPVVLKCCVCALPVAPPKVTELLVARKASELPAPPKTTESPVARRRLSTSLRPALLPRRSFSSTGGVAPGAERGSSRGLHSQVRTQSASKRSCLVCDSISWMSDFTGPRAWRRSVRSFRSASSMRSSRWQLFTRTSRIQGSNGTLAFSRRFKIRCAP